MNFFQYKLNGVQRRMNSIKYGMFYWRNRDYRIPSNLTINGKEKVFKVEGMNISEFTGICINDCYRLKYLRKKLGTVKHIVDVGANSGMFAIAARQFFPQAAIHCYEPNPKLKDILEFNTKQLNAVTYMEAVMKNDCKVSLNFTESDLATTANVSEQGIVTGSSLSTVINRIGEIDILKMDCEGAEWEILLDTESWKQIKSVSMEYHLWGKCGSKIEDILDLLDKINFRLVEHAISDSNQGLILALNKTVF
jgi:FkbM family methyltransferase